MKLFTLVMALLITVVSVGFMPLFGEDMIPVESSGYDSNCEVLNEEPEQKYSIFSMDVNSDGWYVLGLTPGIFIDGSRYICVYDSNGVFQFGLSLDLLGALTYSLELDDELNIYIYNVKSQIVDIFDKQGHIQRYEYEEYSTFSSDVERIREHKHFKEVNGVTYKIRNDFFFLIAMFAGNCSQMVKVDGNGNESILYDSGNYYWPKVLIGMFVIGGIFLLAILHAIKYVKNYQKGIIPDRNEYHPDYHPECEPPDSN